VDCPDWDPLKLSLAFFGLLACSSVSLGYQSISPSKRSSESPAEERLGLVGVEGGEPSLASEEAAMAKRLWSSTSSNQTADGCNSESMAQQTVTVQWNSRNALHCSPIARGQT
jgi:hypothetical protein